MKKYLNAALAGLCLVSSAPGQTKEARVTVAGGAAAGRRSETVEVRLRDLAQFTDDETGGRFIVRARGSHEEIRSQVTQEELLFQSDFLPGRTKEFTVRRTHEQEPPTGSRVAGMFALPREDYAWENDRIAFRMYGPALRSEVNNGIDVWTKRVRSLIVAKWYREAEGSPAGKDPYHQDRGEGADFFDVGRSLGAGGCALWYEGKVRQPGVFSRWKTIAVGPVRTAFELTYPGVTLGGMTFTERVTISLDAGRNLNKIQVTFDAAEPGRRVLVACGLVKRAGTFLSSDSAQGWMGLWGPTNRDSVNGSLGTGVVTGPSAFVQFAEDPAQYLLIVGAVTGEPFTYYAGAGWTRSGDFAVREDWNSYLKEEAAAINSPLRVTCGPGGD